MNEIITVVEKALPFLNILLIPAIRLAWKVGKRLDTIEFNQRRLCDKVGIKYIEVKL